MTDVAVDLERHPSDVAYSILGVCDSANVCLTEGELARLENAAEYIEEVGEVLGEVE